MSVFWAADLPIGIGLREVEEALYAAEEAAGELPRATSTIRRALTLLAHRDGDVPSTADVLQAAGRSITEALLTRWAEDYRDIYEDELAVWAEICALPPVETTDEDEVVDALILLASTGGDIPGTADLLRRRGKPIKATVLKKWAEDVHREMYDELVAFEAGLRARAAADEAEAIAVLWGRLSRLDPGRSQQIAYRYHQEAEMRAREAAARARSTENLAAAAAARARDDSFNESMSNFANQAADEAPQLR